MRGWQSHIGSITVWRDEFTEKTREKIKKKTVNIRITLLEFTRTYLKYRDTGSGVPWCAKNENRTRTHITRFGSTAGLPAP